MFIFTHTTSPRFVVMMRRVFLFTLIIYSCMCLHPKHVHGQVFPCGHCVQCLNQKTADISNKLYEAFGEWKEIGRSPSGYPIKPIIYATLTYSEESIPKTFLYYTNYGARLYKRFIEAKYNRHLGEPGVSPVYSYEGVTPAAFGVVPDILEFDVTTNVSGWKSLQTRRHNEAFAHALRCYEFLSVSGVVVDHAPKVGALDSFKQYLESEYDVILSDADGCVPLVTGDPRPGEFVLFDKVIAFNTCRSNDLSDWLKRCRRRLEYHLPETLKPVAVRVSDERSVMANPRFIPVHGNYVMPECAIPKTVKCFYATEYGSQTSRPHFHLIICGLSLDEFREFFLSDWNRLFGSSIDYSYVCSEGGAANYVSKYCSKACYDNPYSTRFYNFPGSGRWYYSKHFEYCVDKFHVDCPICETARHYTFCGLGQSYVLRQASKSDSPVRLEPIFSPVRGVMRYLSVDVMVHGLIPDYLNVSNFDQSIDWNSVFGFNGTTSKAELISLDDPYLPPSIAPVPSDLFATGFVLPETRVLKITHSRVNYDDYHVPTYQVPLNVSYVRLDSGPRDYVADMMRSINISYSSFRCPVLVPKNLYRTWHLSNQPLKRGKPKNFTRPLPPSYRSYLISSASSLERQYYASVVGGSSSCESYFEPFERTLVLPSGLRVGDLYPSVSRSDAAVCASMREKALSFAFGIKFRDDKLFAAREWRYQNSLI